MMMIPTFSPLKPNEKCKDFYDTFYKQYNMIQINDIIMNELLDSLGDEERKGLVDNLILDGFEIQRNAVYSIGMGIYDPSLQRSSREDRGLDISLFRDLDNMKVDPLKWYLQANEFMQLYAVCEQTIKDYLASCDFDMAKFKERKMMIQFFDILREKKIVDNYIELISQSTNEILTKENEVKFVWEYYTEIRNVYMHAGGRLTERFKKNMDKLLQNYAHEISCIMNSKSMIMELVTFYYGDDEDDEDDFFNNPVGNIIICKSQKINFFRNFVIIIMECLNKALTKEECK